MYIKHRIQSNIESEMLREVLFLINFTLTGYVAGDVD